MPQFLPKTKSMTDLIENTDVAVIGAGPVGLFAVFACGMLGLKTHVIDALPDIGGQCTALYPDKPIYDIPASPSIQAGHLIERLESQAAPFQPVYHLGQAVSALRGNAKDGFVLETSQSKRIHARAIMICAGAGAFGPNRPPLENLDLYENKSVFYMIRDPQRFKDKNVVIAGGGDSALDWSVILSDIAQTVSLVHRRDRFRGAPETVSKIKALAEQGKIDLVTPYQLKALNGANGALTSVSVQTLEGQTRDLDADYLLAFFGLAADLGPIADWGLALEKAQIGIDPLTGATNVPGIYAAGDVTAYPHKLKLIMTGFTEATQGAHAIWQLLNPDQALHFEHSTSRGLPLA